MACTTGAALRALEMDEDDRSEGQQLLVDMAEHLAECAEPGTPIVGVVISKEHERMLREVVGDDGPLLIFGTAPTIGPVDFPEFTLGGTA